MDENEKVEIGFVTCRDLLVVLIYGPCGVDNCIVVLIQDVNEDCEEWKLFCLISNARYYGSAIGIKVFWPYKYLFLNDEVV
jgi:hypothetical protein